MFISSPVKLDILPGIIATFPNIFLPNKISKIMSNRTKMNIKTQNLNNFFSKSYFFCKILKEMMKIMININFKTLGSDKYKFSENIRLTNREIKKINSKKIRFFSFLIVDNLMLFGKKIKIIPTEINARFINKFPIKNVNG